MNRAILLSVCFLTFTASLFAEKRSIAGRIYDITAYENWRAVEKTAKIESAKPAGMQWWHQIGVNLRERQATGDWVAYVSYDSDKSFKKSLVLLKHLPASRVIKGVNATGRPMTRTETFSAGRDTYFIWACKLGSNTTVTYKGVSASVPVFDYGTVIP